MVLVEKNKNTYDWGNGTLKINAFSGVKSLVERWKGIEKYSDESFYPRIPIVYLSLPDKKISMYLKNSRYTRRFLKIIVLAKLLDQVFLAGMVLAFCFFCHTVFLVNKDKTIIPFMPRVFLAVSLFMGVFWAFVSIFILRRYILGGLSRYREDDSDDDWRRGGGEDPPQEDPEPFPEIPSAMRLFISEISTNAPV